MPGHSARYGNVFFPYLFLELFSVIDQLRAIAAQLLRERQFSWQEAMARRSEISLLESKSKS